MLSRPNKTRIKLRTITSKENAQFPGKLDLVIEILPVAGQAVSSFIKPGMQIEAYAFENPALFTPGSVVVADGEFIGVMGDGKVRLSNAASSEEE